MRKVSLILGLLLAFAARADGRDIFVDNAIGDDLLDGSVPMAITDRAGPTRTLAKALRLAQNGDAIVLAKTGRHYRESISLVGGDHGGNIVNEFIILGNGATLDGSFPAPPDAWEHYSGDVYRMQPERMAFAQLFIDDKPAIRRELPSDRLRADQLGVREWDLHGGHLYFRTSPNRSIYGYNLSYTGRPVGITLYKVRRVLIADLVIQGFQLDGVNAHDGAVDCTLERLVCRGNGRSGVAVGGSSQVVLRDCSLRYNGVSQLWTEGRSLTQLINCDLSETTAPAIHSTGGDVLGADNTGVE